MVFELSRPLKKGEREETKQFYGGVFYLKKHLAFGGSVTGSVITGGLRRSKNSAFKRKVSLPVPVLIQRHSAGLGRDLAQAVRHRRHHIGQVPQ